MKKYIFFYLLAFSLLKMKESKECKIMLASTLASAANHSEELAKIGKSCENAKHYQDCFRAEFFNNLKQK